MKWPAFKCFVCCVRVTASTAKTCKNSVYELLLQGRDVILCMLDVDTKDKRGYEALKLRHGSS